MKNGFLGLVGAVALYAGMSLGCAGYMPRVEIKTIESTDERNFVASQGRHLELTLVDLTADCKADEIQADVYAVDSNGNNPHFLHRLMDEEGDGTWDKIAYGIDYDGKSEGISDWYLLGKDSQGNGFLDPFVRISRRMELPLHQFVKEPLLKKCVSIEELEEK